MQSSLKRFNEEYDVKLETCDRVQNSEDFKDFKDLNLIRMKSFHELLELEKESNNQQINEIIDEIINTIKENPRNWTIDLSQLNSY